MFKIALILSVGDWSEREDLFFETKREASRWLDFYRRTDNFIDSNGHATPITHSYMLKFPM